MTIFNVILSLQEKKEKEEVMDELEVKVAELQTELQRQREQLRVERERWHDEMEAAHQVSQQQCICVCINWCSYSSGIQLVFS